LNQPQIDAEDEARFSHDISFAGSSLISVTNSFLLLKEKLLGQDESNADEKNRILWDLIGQAMADQESYTRRSEYQWPALIQERLGSSAFAHILKPELLHTFLGKECCRFQRLYFLDALRDFKVGVYGAEDWREAKMPHISYGGYLDYATEAPKLFHQSRINLNIARIYSMDGMSDRVANVLSVGGFLITNAVEDIASCYQPGKELVVFRTAEELRECCAYYLAHPEERRAIGEAGRARVAQHHSVPVKLAAMFAFYEDNPPPTA
jgi:spore maturation protein CgeB